MSFFGSLFVVLRVALLQLTSLHMSQVETGTSSVTKLGP